MQERNLDIRRYCTPKIPGRTRNNDNDMFLVLNARDCTKISKTIAIPIPKGPKYLYIVACRVFSFGITE